MLMALGAGSLHVGVLPAQCSNPTTIPSGSYPSGDHSQVDNNALTTGSLFGLTGTATATFVAGNCIRLAPEFTAASEHPNRFHAWVDVGPRAVTFSPASGSGQSQQFTFTVSNPSGQNNLAHVFALFRKDDASSTTNACYIHYDPSADLVYLANNESDNWSNGFTPQSSGSAGNSQCTVSGSGIPASRVDTQLTVKVVVTFQTSFQGTKYEYLYAADSSGLNTAWQWMGTWDVPGSTPPAPTVTCSAAPNPAVLGQTVTFAANVVNGSPPFSYFWSGDVSGTQPTASFTPATGGTYNANIQVRDALSRTATNSCEVVVNAPTTITTIPAGLKVTVDGVDCNSTPCTYYWAPGTPKTISAALTQAPNYFSYWSDNGGLSHTITALSTPQTFTANYFPDGAWALKQCVEGSASPVCTLAEGTHTVTNTITVTRSNVKLIGTGANELQAKLLRGPTFRDPLIAIDAPTFVAPGIKLENFTVCGGLDVIRDTHGPSDVNLGASAVGCPRQQTTPLFNSTSCGDMLRRITRSTESDFPPAQTWNSSTAYNLYDLVTYNNKTYTCIQANIDRKPDINPAYWTEDFECTDIDVRRVDTGEYQSYPFPSTTNYALTLKRVRLEDSAGHALSLFENAAASPPAHVNDVHIYDSYINGSAITGILYGASGAPDYHTQVCDTNANWLSDQTVFAPRNLRIEGNHFTNNNTGAMGGGAVRWVGLRNNWFTNNYIHPQVGNGAGGTVEFRPCADKIEITGNHFIGPTEVVYNTPALELYARNVHIQGNPEIRNYPLEGIALMGVFGATVAGNTIANNHRDPWPRTGAVAVATSESITGPCGDPRDSRNVVITGNEISDPLYAVYLGEHDPRSSAILRHTPAKALAVEVAGNTGQLELGRDSTVVLDSYFPPATTVPEEPGPRALTVRAVGPVTSRCSTSTQPQTFAFPARHPEGAANISLIEVYFSALAENDPQNGHGSGAGGCHFLLYPQANQVWLFDALPGTPSGSTLGPDGSSLSNGHCTIHAGQTPLPMAEPFIGPFIST